MDKYPVIYHDAAQPDKSSKYLVLHEVISRHNNNYQGRDQWRQYRGIITWNPLIHNDNKDTLNMVFCNQYMNMYVERTDNYILFEDRPNELCAIYGSPASVDTPIMMARYDVPLSLSRQGLQFDAYGTIPPTNRPEFRNKWKDHYRGAIPIWSKNTVLKDYRFSMAFENSRDPYYAAGWVTEKIYDCLGSGTIPIYWGASNITDIIPSEIFIDYREFESDLYQYLTQTPHSVFSKMSRNGLDFFDSVNFAKYLEVFESLC